MIPPKSEYDTAGKGHLLPPLTLRNQYEDDLVLQSTLSRLLPPSALKRIEPDLIRMGHLSATSYLDLANEQEQNPPKLQKYDAFGNPINKLITSITGQEGIHLTNSKRQSNQKQLSLEGFLIERNLFDTLRGFSKLK